MACWSRWTDFWSWASEYRIVNDEVIGEGSFSVVYRCQSRSEPKKRLAIKKITWNPTSSEATRIQLEIDTMRHLAHAKNPYKHVVEFIHVIKSQREILIVMPLACGNVREWMQRSRKKDLEQILLNRWTKQILCAVNFLHQHQILHRDLKPENLLLFNHQNQLSIKLADFNSARFLTTQDDAFDSTRPIKTIYSSNGILQIVEERTTLWYRAPEILLGASVDGPWIDWWSVACILVEIYNRSPIFPTSTSWETIINIFSLLGTPGGARLWPDCRALPHFSTDFPKWEPNLVWQHENYPDADTLAGWLVRTFLVLDPCKRMLGVKTTFFLASVNE